MNIRVLRYFLTVAREGSITRAAKFLHVTQPTLSRQLKDMEEELGKKLFVRSNYSIKLTDEGMLLKKRAEDILEMVDKTKAEFLSMDDVSGGDIHIAAAETDGIKYIAGTAKCLRSRYPNMRYHFISGNYNDVTERLDRGLADFGIVVDPAGLSRYSYITLPPKDTWGVLMRKDSPLASKGSIRVEDLLDVPLILSRQAIQQPLSENEFSEWFGEAFDRLNIAATFSLLFNASIMVSEGLGYAITFDKIANTGSDSDFAFRPLEPALEAGMHIIWKKYQMFSPAAEIFLDEIRRRYAPAKDE